MMEKPKKKNIIEKFKTHPTDTGSSSVQIAIISERIKELTDHLKTHKKDFHSRRGLLLLVGKRRRLLNYIKDNDPDGYSKVIKALKIKK